MKQASCGWRGVRVRVSANVGKCVCAIGELGGPGERRWGGKEPGQQEQKANLPFQIQN